MEKSLDFQICILENGNNNNLYATEEDNGNMFFSMIFYRISYVPEMLSKKFVVNYQDIKQYYKGRDYVINQKNKKSVLLCLDGSLDPSEEYIFNSKDKALSFCYFIEMQKNKYDLFIDKQTIINFNQIEVDLFLKFYEFMETMRWPGSHDEFRETLSLYMNLIESKKVNKLLLKNKYLSKFISKIDFKFKYYDNPPIKNISGLLSVSLFRSLKYNKNIYLLGEKHTNNVQCSDFLEFSSDNRKIYDPYRGVFVDKETEEGKYLFEKLKKSKSVYIRTFVDSILNNNLFFVDFLYEQWYTRLKNTKKDYLKGGSAFDSFNDNPCLEREYQNIYSKQQHKGQEECFFYRIENIDYRQRDEDKIKDSIKNKIIDFFENEKNIFFTFRFLGYENTPQVLKNKITPTLLEFAYVKRIIDLFKSEKGRRQIFEYIKDFLYKDEQFMKDIKKSYLYDDILVFIGLDMEKSLLQFNNTLKENGEFLYLYESIDTLETKLEVCQIITTFLTMINSYIMDGFFLSKLFKKMKHDPNEEHGPDEIRNCVVYAGRRHITTYKNFLKYIGFDEISSSEAKSTKSCVNIENFSQPFFKF